MSATDIARPRFARMYLKASKGAEQRGATGHRRRLLGGLAGTVVEIGAGHGLNFRHYPTTVTEVIAIEPEPTLRARAAEAMERAGFEIQTRERLMFAAARLQPAIPYILGTARRT